MAGIAVLTTRTSSATMKKATEVRASVQPADERLGVIRMSPHRDRAAAPRGASVDRPTHPSDAGGGPRSTAIRNFFRALRGGADRPAVAAGWRAALGFRWGRSPATRGAPVPPARR